MADFVISPLKSNSTNRGEAPPDGEITMMEAIAYFADDETNQAEMQGIHPFQFKCHKQVKWTIMQLTIQMWNKEDWVRDPKELKRVERNGARTLYKIASYVNNNLKPRLGAQQPLKANYVSKLLALGEYEPFYKHLSKRCQEKLKYYLSMIKYHFKVRDELKKTIRVEQRKYHYF